jgi:hypothetical protein
MRNYAVNVLLREPLCHFLLLGLGLFLIEGLFNPQDQISPYDINVKLGSDESFYNLKIYEVFTDLSVAIKKKGEKKKEAGTLEKEFNVVIDEV